MIKVKEKELEEFLTSRRDNIERPMYTGISEIVSGIALIFTVFSSDFDKNLWLDPGLMDLLTFLLGVLMIALGVYSFVMGFKQRQTVKNLYESICELDTSRVHVVNILLLSQQSTGKYLLVKNDAWNCPLFPSYYATTNPYDKAAEAIRMGMVFSRDTGYTIKSVTYLQATKKHIKLCEGENLPYRYEFHFFRVEVDENPGELRSYGGKRYIWRTLDSMWRNKNIMAKNSDVVSFVADMESIPYN